MPNAALLRKQIEADLATRIPSALTPVARTIREVQATGIPEIDSALNGGLAVGAISEIVGPECSGRTSLALATIAQLTREGRACAWVDANDSLDPESAAANGIQLSQLLWVRCGPRNMSTIHSQILPTAGYAHPNSHTFSIQAVAQDRIHEVKSRDWIVRLKSFFIIQSMMQNSRRLERQALRIAASAKCQEVSRRQLTAPLTRRKEFLMAHHEPLFPRTLEASATTAISIFLLINLRHCRVLRPVAHAVETTGSGIASY